MHRVIWLTDLHLNFADAEAIEGLGQEVAAANADTILMGGDIGESSSVVRFIERLYAVFREPTYVVLGNHDFYGGGIAAVRADVARLCSEVSGLHFLTCASAPVKLTDRVALVGHDGWADAREGDYHRSLVMMNDYRLIDELARFSKQDRLAELHRMGDEAAQHVRVQLARALTAFQHVLVLTHVPPVRAACWYEGEISDDEWAPHFVCQAMGRAILDVACIHPGKEVTVLCGHTHSGGECRPAPNVKVITGAAEYAAPRITQVFDLV